MELSIDTSDSKKIKVRMGSRIKKIEVEEGIKFLKSEACLPLIDKICKENNLSIYDIIKINVNEGPGSFTGLRVGISIANAMSYLLKIPVNNKKIGDFVFPVYN